MTEDALNEALRVAGAGWPVFPIWWIEDGTCACQLYGGDYWLDRGCPEDNWGKHPLSVLEYGIKNWRSDATTDPDTIRAIWTARPRANVGTEPGRSGLLVIDIDPRNGGEESFYRWEATNRLGPVEDGFPTPVFLPPTLASLTGSGGAHLFFRLPEGKTISSHNGWLEGVDIKSSGGYVVLPPSSHKSGGTYSWNAVLPIADLPMPLIGDFETRFGSGSTSGKKRSGSLGDGDYERTLTRSTEDILENGFPEGGVGDPDSLGRDNGLFKFACRLRGRLGPDSFNEVLSMVEEAARHCRPPFSEDEAKIKVKSAFKYDYDGDAEDYAGVAAALTLPTVGDAAEEIAAAAEPRKSRLRSGSNVIRSTTIPWLIDGAIHQSGLGQLSAPENTGKSIITAGLALSVANGLEHWAGFKIDRSGPVVYCAMEGGPVIQTYIDAWLKAHPGTDLENFYLLDEEQLDFTDEKSVLELMRDVVAEGIKPVLYVFDTQIDVTGATDEMLPVMGQLLAKLRIWLTSQDAFGLLLHHPPYGAERGRGTTAVRGKADVLAFASKDKKRITFQKVKGVLEPKPFSFEIRAVPGSAGAVAVFDRDPGVGDLASSEAATEATASIAKDELTRTAILSMLPEPTEALDEGRKVGWNNTEVGRALDALSTRPTEDGGPVDVHINRRFFSPILDDLADQGLIRDLSVSWSTGKARQWVLTPGDEIPESDE